MIFVWVLLLLYVLPLLLNLLIINNLEDILGEDPMFPDEFNKMSFVPIANLPVLATVLIGCFLLLLDKAVDLENTSKKIGELFRIKGYFRKSKD